MSMGRKRDEGPDLAVYESVQCLECGAVYAKPSRGGTARSNPGCPDCGYVGWVAVHVPLRGARAQLRSDADRPLGRSAQSR
jgi:predicted  nucleic acid-binding Zn-ribbon protein